MKLPPYRLKKIWMLLAGFILAFLLTIPVKLAIAYYQTPLPQAILTLGGGSSREEFTAFFAQYYPDMKIWVSSGTPPHKAREIFRAAGIADHRLHLDYSATDTVTNFTTLVDIFQQQQIQHIFLITSDFHMPRAKAIATIVLGSRGIAFTPVSIASKKTELESILRIVRDIVRSLLWIVTGYTGTEF
ncbi:YdcF family protein [Anabaena subtropica]|uniref:YdcF family protein n=1 Tax=Anabaena subtropica FACHB-260 TaxID=2692884 RepID=A0ABR8CTG6_9NOST|nr:YdcF family protein [Anabaena subtropica]MBD2345492.1 YdcF family protein [Anabaena subtropica FACHB-260]